MSEGDPRVHAVQGREPGVLDMDAADAARAREGDVHAFERLYRRHVPRIHGLARRMLGGEDVDEAVQDVFVRVWEKLALFRGDASFGTWLYRVAINVILARRKKTGTRSDRFRSGMEEELARASVRAPRPELKVTFERAVEALPAGAREIFVLHDVEGYKHDEIAELLGISNGTSKSQLHRARMALRSALG